MSKVLTVLKQDDNLGDIFRILPDCPFSGVLQKHKMIKTAEKKLLE